VAREFLTQPHEVWIGNQRVPLAPDVRIGMTQAIQIGPGQGGPSQGRQCVSLAAPHQRSRRPGPDHGGAIGLYRREWWDARYSRQPHVGRRAAAASLRGDLHHNARGICPDIPRLRFPRGR
jgi:hypothetical protein